MRNNSAGAKCKERRILVIRLSALGDVAMTLPAVYSLAEAFPDVGVDVLTRPFFARLFINRPANVNLITADFKNEYRGLLGMLRLFLRLSRNSYHAVADLHNVSRSWVLDLLFRVIGTPVFMVDKMRRGRKAVLHSHARQQNFTDRYVDVFRRMGYEVSLTFRSLFPNDAPDTPLVIPAGSVGIAPFARYATKTYPIELMEQVVGRLCDRGVSVFLFGGRGKEAKILNSWADRYEGCTSLAGLYPLETELALMSRLKLMIAMDSANHHLAALAGVRVLSLWGGTTPACGFMAYGQSEHNALCLGLDCQPCSIGGSRVCRLGTTECLHSLKPSAILKRALEMFDEK